MPLRGTAGCTAVSSAHLEQLLHWLDARKNPLIVQLPLPEYFLLRRFWELPEFNRIDELADCAQHPVKARLLLLPSDLVTCCLI